MFWKLIPPILSAIALLITAVLDYLHRDRRTRKFKKGRSILFAVIALFLLISPIAVYVDEQNHRAESKRLAEELDTLKKQAQTQMAITTGGDSYGIIVYMGIDKPNASSITPMFVSFGNFPLYDVEVFAMVLPKGAPIPSPVTLGNLAPLQIKGLGEWKLPNKMDRVDFEIFINARNGVLQQLSSFRRISGNWKVASKVFKQDSGHVLNESIPDDFPRDSSGKVDWVMVIEPNPYVDIRPFRLKPEK